MVTPFKYGKDCVYMVFLIIHPTYYWFIIACSSFGAFTSTNDLYCILSVQNNRTDENG